MPHRQKSKKLSAKTTSEVSNGAVEHVPPNSAVPQRRGPGRPRKVVLEKLLVEQQLWFLRGANFDPADVKFVDRHSVQVTPECDAWWNGETGRVLFVNAHAKSEFQFLASAGLVDRAELEMRIQGLTVYRITGKLPEWGE